MPSWNVHTAHVEHLLASRKPAELGIEDANAFLFGNYVPDIYVGFMVPGVSMHIDYCITHVAKISKIPVCNADFFWNQNIAYRMPFTPAGRSLMLGTWAHLVADRYFNGTFRTFWAEHDMELGDELRINPYRMLADDVRRAIETASEITREGGALPINPTGYQLLDYDWLFNVFEACNERLETWLLAWQRLLRDGRRCMSVDIREEAGLPPATPDPGELTR